MMPAIGSTTPTNDILLTSSEVVAVVAFMHECVSSPEPSYESSTETLFEWQKRCDMVILINIKFQLARMIIRNYNYYVSEHSQ
jgi:hypothetical protein